MDISAIGPAKALAALYGGAVSKIFAGQDSRVPTLIDETEAAEILSVNKTGHICSVVLANVAYTVDCEEQETVDGVVRWVPKQVVHHTHSSIHIDVKFPFETDEEGYRSYGNDIDLTDFDKIYGEGFGKEILSAAIDKEEAPAMAPPSAKVIA